VSDLIAEMVENEQAPLMAPADVPPMWEWISNEIGLRPKEVWVASFVCRKEPRMMSKRLKQFE